MLKPLVPKFCPDPSARLKDIAKKTSPREAETDSAWSFMYRMSGKKLTREILNKIVRIYSIGLIFT